MSPIRHGEQFDIEQAAILLAAIVISANEAILSKNLDGIITSWNKASERLFGYRAAEIIGQSVRLLIPEDRQSEEDAILLCIADGEIIENYETVRVGKDQVPFPASVTISPVRSRDGSIVGASTIVRDISKCRGSRGQLEMVEKEIQQSRAVWLDKVEEIASEYFEEADPSAFKAFIEAVRAVECGAVN